jgi:hypothetical protein
VASAGADQSHQNTVTLATVGPFTLQGSCWNEIPGDVTYAQRTSTRVRSTRSWERRQSNDTSPNTSPTPTSKPSPTHSKRSAPTHDRSAPAASIARRPPPTPAKSH